MNCQMCDSPSKYKCPSCSCRTCSLVCVDTHKTLTGCSGVNQPQMKVKIKDFTNSHFKSDIAFLSGIVKTCDVAHKATMKLIRQDTRKRLTYLKNELRQRELDVRFTPKSMSKHVLNTTWFSKNDNAIYWHIEWKFTTLDAAAIVIHTASNNEEKPLGDHLTVALTEFRKSPQFTYLFSLSTCKEFILLWSAGKCKYGDTPITTYRRVLPCTSLRQLIDCLSTPPYFLVEFPTVHLTTQDHIRKFHLID